MYNGKWESGGADLVAPWKEGGRGKYAGQPIVVFGGSTSIGQFGASHLPRLTSSCGNANGVSSAIQLAKVSGFSPIITTVSPHNEQLVKSLGATHTINRTLLAGEIVAKVKSITTQPVKIVYDTISDVSSQIPAHDILASGGTLVLVLPSVIPTRKRTLDKTVITTLGTVHAEMNREIGRELYSNITEYLKSGDLKVRICK